MFDQLRSWLARVISPSANVREKAMGGLPSGTPTSVRFGPRRPPKKYERPGEKPEAEEILRKGLQGDGYFGWTSDHREESEQLQGWVAVAIAALGKAAAESKYTIVKQIPPDDDSGGQELDEKPVPWRHPLVQLLRKPNPAYGYSGLMKRIVVQRALTGSAFVWGVRSKEDGPDGPPCELYVIPTALVYPAPPTSELPRGGYRVSASALLTMFSGMYAGVGLGGLASWYTIDARHMLRLSNYHPLTEGDGLSPLHANRRQIDVAVAMEEMIWAILENGAFPAGILSMAPNAAAGADQVQAIIEQAKQWIEAEYGGPDRAGKIMPVYGMTYQQLSQTLSAAVPADLREQNRNNTFATYGVSSVVAGFQEGGSYSANHAAKQQFVDNVAQPEFTEIADLLSIRLADHWGEDLTVKIEAKPVNDQEFDLKKIETKANLQLYTVDEIRAMHGDGPHPDPEIGKLPPGAVVPYVQATMIQQPQDGQPAGDNPAGDPLQGDNPPAVGADGTQGGQLPAFPNQPEPMKQGMPTAALDELAGYSNRLKGYDPFPLPATDPFPEPPPVAQLPAVQPAAPAIPAAGPPPVPRETPGDLFLRLLRRQSRLMDKLAERPPPTVHVHPPATASPNVTVNPPTVNVHPPTVNVQPADVHVHPPAVTVHSPAVNVQPAEVRMPDIHVDSPTVHVASPEIRLPEQRPPVVHVHVPEAERPVVNVHPPDVRVPPAVVNVTVPPPTVTVNAVVPPRRTSLTVERDEDGLIQRIDRAETDAAD